MIPSPFVAFIGNIPLLKTLRVNSRPSQRAYTLSEASLYLSLPSLFFSLDLLLTSTKFSDRLH